MKTMWLARDARTGVGGPRMTPMSIGCGSRRRRVPRNMSPQTHTSTRTILKVMVGRREALSRLIVAVEEELGSLKWMVDEAVQGELHG